MDYKLQLAGILAINIIASVFIIGHITRSTILKKGFSRATWKAYLAVFLGTVIANLALTNALAPEALTALLGAVIGGVFGRDSTNQKDDDDK